jgi:phosphoribosylaminoimidazole carboxylase (NCAIR synthetase)
VVNSQVPQIELEKRVHYFFKGEIDRQRRTGHVTQTNKTYLKGQLRIKFNEQYLLRRSVKKWYKQNL